MDKLITEYTITFEDIDEEDFITEDKQEADAKIEELKDNGEFYKVYQYYAKDWVYNDETGDWEESDVEVYYTKGEDEELKENSEIPMYIDEYYPTRQEAKAAEKVLKQQGRKTKVERHGNEYIVWTSYEKVEEDINQEDKIEYNIYTISGGDGVYNSHKVDTVETEEQAIDRVSELEAETGSGAYYTKVVNGKELEEASEADDRFENRYMNGGNGFTANKKVKTEARRNNKQLDYKLDGFKGVIISVVDKKNGINTEEYIKFDSMNFGIDEDEFEDSMVDDIKNVLINLYEFSDVYYDDVFMSDEITAVARDITQNVLQLYDDLPEENIDREKGYAKLNESKSSKLNIEYVTPNYTGGGIYVYTGKLKDGNYFIADDTYFGKEGDTFSPFDIRVVDTDPDKVYTDEDGLEYTLLDDIYYQEQHFVEDIEEDDAKEFTKMILQWVIDNKPEGNYQIGEMEEYLYIATGTDKVEEAKSSNNKYEIEYVTPNYTGGNVYVYTGKLKDGNYFIADDGYFTADDDGNVPGFDVRIVNMDPDKVLETDSDGLAYTLVDDVELQNEHLVKDLDENEAIPFTLDLLNWIIKNEPEGNYNIGELQDELNILKKSVQRNNKSINENKDLTEAVGNINVNETIRDLISQINGWFENNKIDKLVLYEETPYYGIVTTNILDKELYDKYGTTAYTPEDEQVFNQDGFGYEVIKYLENYLKTLKTNRVTESLHLDRIQTIVDELKQEPMVKKYLYDTTWLSGSSTTVYPIEIGKQDITLQWKSDKNIFNSFIKKIVDKYPEISDGWFSKTDGEEPSSITFKLAENIEENNKVTEAVDNTQKQEDEKEEIEQQEEIIDTENELEEGIKKEIYQYAKQQGLDIEKLRKQGIELETLEETLDTVIGNMVSKSAIEYMDKIGKDITWDFEVSGNDIKIIWNEV